MASGVDDNDVNNMASVRANDGFASLDFTNSSVLSILSFHWQTRAHVKMDLNWLNLGWQRKN